MNSFAYVHGGNRKRSALQRARVSSLQESNPAGALGGLGRGMDLVRWETSKRCPSARPSSSTACIGSVAAP